MFPELGSDRLLGTMKRRHFFLGLAGAPLLAQTAAQTAPQTPAQTAPSRAPAPDLEWTDAKKLTVEGLGFKDVKSPYDRLPGRAEGVVPAPVWNLSRDSAGAAVRFMASAPTIHARWTVTNKNLAGSNITAIASSGLDMYAKTDEGHWRWLGLRRARSSPIPRRPWSTAFPRRRASSWSTCRCATASPRSNSACPRALPSSPDRRAPAGSKPILFYGTSITHGIGASRAGMTHVAMLGRIFNREVINLGFSGNGAHGA